MAEVLFRAKLTREDVSSPWGFRLQGGVEYDKPLTLLKVVAESLAAKGGLHPGDIVVKLAGKSADDMTHKDAQEAIISAGNHLEIIVERAEVTIAAPTSPPATTSDTTKTTVSKTTATSTESATTVTTTDSLGNDESVTTATEKKPQAAGVSEHDLQCDIGEHSTEPIIPDKDNHRTTITDRTAVSSDNSVSEKSANTIIEAENSSSEKECDVVQCPPSSDINDDGDAGTSKSISKALQNDKLAKDSSRVAHIKPSEPPNKESCTEEVDTLPNSKHKPVQELNKIPQDVGTDTSQDAATSTPSDIETVTPQDTGKDTSLDTGKDTPLDTEDTEDTQPCAIVDDAVVTTPVCDTNQHTSDTTPESIAVLDIKENETPSNSIVHTSSVSTPKQLQPAISQALPLPVMPDDRLDHASSSDVSKPSDAIAEPEPETDVNLNSIKKLSIVSETLDGLHVVDQCASVEYDTKTDLKHITGEPGVSDVKVSNDLDLSKGVVDRPLSPTSDSKHISEQITEAASSTKPCIISEPSVINEFQSQDVTVVQPPTKMAPSSSSKVVGASPDPPKGQHEHPEALSQAPHIPIRSQTDVKRNFTIASPILEPVPISMVVSDVPKMTINASAIETKLTPCEQPGKSASSTLPTKTAPTHGDSEINDVAIKSSNNSSSSISSTYSETGMSPMPVSMPIQIPQLSREGVSRQTNAPAEEIIIAPKPSVQIMTSPEHRETIQVPTGDKRSEEAIEEESPMDVATPLVSHEMKDFSKTAPWRMHKHSGSTSQLNTLHRSSDQSILHPWRKSRLEHPMSHSLDERQLSAAEDRMNEAANITPTQIGTSGIINTTETPSTPPTLVSNEDVNQPSVSMKKPQSTLTYVGKRIESPVSSPVTISTPFFQLNQMTPVPVPAGRDVPPSERSNTIPLSHTTLPSTSDPISMLIPSPTSELYSPQPEEIHFQAAAPDLVDIPMPAVKEMVENLNKRLQAIAVQHPKIVEPADVQELGLNFFRQTGTDLAGHPYEIYHHDTGEQEIIIDTPPNPNFTATSLEDIKQRLFGPEAGLYQVYEYLEPVGSPGAHRRRFSLPGGSVSYNRHNQRRVRFAEPPESSVIEIEPRKQRHRRLWDDDGTMSDMEDYSSASILAAKLDRIERENALSTASFQRHRNAKQRAQSISGDIAQTKPIETFREKVISFESLGEPKQDDVVLSSLKPVTKEKFLLGPGRSGSRGFSLSIGQNKPGSISLSLTHQRGSGQPPTQVALSVPSTEGHFSYIISPKTGSAEPVAIKYSVPSHMINEPIVKTVTGEHVKAHSLDSARTVHIQYPPQEGVPTIQTQLLSQTSVAGPLSPQQQVMRQLAGRPGIRSPTNYSNTLQIDTSSRLQHSSPSPPNPSYPPTIQTDRSHLSPQRLIHPQARLPDTSAAEYQAQRSSSPSIGAPIGIKVRQPSPTNPMAYQRSTSPQGVPQYGPAQSGHPPSLQQASRQLGMPGVQYQQSTGTSYQSSSPRAVSPVSFQQQPVRLQTGSSLGYQRAVSPQGNLSLMVPQSTPYQPAQSPGPGSVSPQTHMMMRHHQQMLQPPGYSMQQSQYQQPSPRISPRPMQTPMGLGPGQVPRGPPGMQQRPPQTRPSGVMPGQLISSGPIIPGGQPISMRQQMSPAQTVPMGQQQMLSGQSIPVGQPMMTGVQGRQPMPGEQPMSGGQPLPGGQLMSGGDVMPGSGGVPYSEAQEVPSSSAGLFALFDKRFTEKFLQWGDERPGDLCRSETYKLVHEMDEQSDDL